VAERLELAREMVANGAPSPISYEPKEIDTFVARVLAEQPRRSPPGWKPRSSLALRIALGAAGGAAIMCGVWSWHVVREGVQPVATYATNANELANITLNDGSKIRLAPHSKLTVARRFGEQHRTVALTGEAHFDVVNASRLPFTVNTGGVSTRVIGTIFDVRQYRPSDTTYVRVISGKVVVAGNKGSIVLHAGEIARATDSTAESVSENIATQYTDWTRGELVFDRASVASVLNTAGHWFGYQFVLADSALARKKVSVSLRTTDTTDMLLQLKTVLDVSMSFDGRKVTLQARRDDIKRPKSTILKPMMEVGR